MQLSRAQRRDSLPCSSSSSSSSSSSGSSRPPHPKGSRSVCCIPGAAGGCGRPACGRACPCQAERAVPGPQRQRPKVGPLPARPATSPQRGHCGPPPPRPAAAHLPNSCGGRSGAPPSSCWRLCGRLHFAPAGQSGPLYRRRLRGVGPAPSPARPPSESGIGPSALGAGGAEPLPCPPPSPHDPSSHLGWERASRDWPASGAGGPGGQVGLRQAPNSGPAGSWGPGMLPARGAPGCGPEGEQR